MKPIPPLWQNGDITFTTVTNKYVVDASSRFFANGAVASGVGSTDPSPSGVYTNVASGVFNPAFASQLVTGGPRALTLNTALAVSSVPIYRGKTYTLTSTDALAHTLTLSGDTFLGAAPTTIATFGAIGAYITFTVVSNTQVSVLGISGVILS